MGFLGFLRGLLLVLLCFVLVPALFVTVIGLNAREKFFDPAFYISLLEKHNTYEQVKNLLIDTIIEGATTQARVQITIEQKSNMKAGLEKTIPTNWIKVQIDRIITNGLAYVKLETETLDLTFSFREIKPEIVSTALKIMGILPIANITFTYPAGCSTIEECMQYCGAPEHFVECQPLMQDLDRAIAQIAPKLGMPCTNLSECAAFCQDERNKDVCERLMMTLFASDPKMRQKLVEQLQVIPDTINLAQEAQVYENLKMMRAFAKEFFFYINIILGATVVIIVLILIISFDIKSACGKLGWPFIIVGLLLLGTSYFGPVIIERIIGALPAEPIIAAVIQPIVFDIVRAFFDVGMQGIVVATVGVILIAFSFFLPGKGMKEGKKR